MKNKKQHNTKQNIAQNSKLLIPDNPTLSGYYLSIWQFFSNIFDEDQTLSFENELADIFNEADKVSRHDTNSISPSTLELNWRSLSSRILYHVQQISQRNQSTKILQYLKEIKEIVSYTNEAQPLAQAAKKEHHNVYVIIKKAISHIEQSVQMYDFDRTSLLLHNFKNDLPKTYTKFFQLSQLDRAQSITAAQDIKKNVDQILKILSNTNQLYVPPADFQSFTRFINQLKLKYDDKKPQNSSHRSKTPPARIPKQPSQKNFLCANTIPLSPPALNIQLSPDYSSPSSARKVRSPRNQAKEISSPPHNKSMQISSSRSKTPPSKILSPTFSNRASKFSPSNIPTRRNQIFDNNSKSNDSFSPHQNQRRSKLSATTQLSPPAIKNRKNNSLNSNETFEKEIENESKLNATTQLSPSATKNRKNNSLNSNETFEKETENESKLNATAQLSPPANKNRKNNSLNSNETFEKETENESKTPSKRKSDFSSTAPNTNESQKRKSRSSKKSPPFSPISFSSQTPSSLPSKKSVNRMQASNNSQASSKKNDQFGNLVSTTINIGRNILQVSTSSEGDNTNNEITLESIKIPESHSTLSQDSETDQLEMAVKKAKDQVKQLSPTLEKLQRDLSSLFNKDDSTSLERSNSPPAIKRQSNNSKSIQKNNDIDNSNDDDDNLDVEIDIDESRFSPKSKDNTKSKIVHSFDSRQSATVSKYSLTKIESCYQEFISKLNQFDNLVEIGLSIKKLNDVSNADQEYLLSKIDESIAAYQTSGLAANEMSLQIGRALSALNKRLDDVETSSDSLIDDYENVSQLIESSNSLNATSSSQQTYQLFIQTLNAQKQYFESSKNVIQLISKKEEKAKKKLKTKSNKNKRKKDDDEIERLTDSNKKLEDEIEKLTMELSNLNDQQKNENVEIENLVKSDVFEMICAQDNNFDADKKLNEMSYVELVNVKNELADQLTEIQKLNESQIIQFKKAKEDFLKKKNEAKSELEDISKQISKVNKALLLCGKNKTVEFQSKIVQREELQEMLLNLIEKENQIVQNINSIS